MSEIQDVEILDKSKLNIVRKRSKKTQILLYDTKRRVDNFILKLKVGDKAPDFALSNATDKLLKQLLDAVAEFDNATRAERTRLGKINRVRSGMWHGGPAPFGYKLVSHRLVVEESDKD